MRLLETGGTGFVMSHVLLNWLQQNPDGSATSVDLAPPDAVAQRFFAPVRDRLEFITGDVSAPDLLDTVPDPTSISHIVCGAAMTPTRGTTERSQAAMIAGVNLMGPVHCLEFARALPDLKRMVHVSTGSVYADDGPEDGSPLSEDGFVWPFPDSLYPITKLTGELLTNRWKALFDLPLGVVRLASVYGPMDRWTPARQSRQVLVQHKCHHAGGIDMLEGVTAASQRCDVRVDPRHRVEPVTCRFLEPVNDTHCCCHQKQEDHTGNSQCGQSASQPHSSSSRQISKLSSHRSNDWAAVRSQRRVQGSIQSLHW